MKTLLFCLRLAVAGVLPWALLPLPAHALLNLDEAVSIAQANDPWLVGSRHRESALRADSVAASALPDPMVSLGIANLPTDTFDFDQEAMTQFRVGLSQVFPRGDSRALTQKRLQQLGDAQPHVRAERRAQVRLNVSRLWLQAYRARASIALIEADRDLFEQLQDIVGASYAAALGRTRQQDLIRAQLELTRLDERLSRLREREQTARSQLLEWLAEPSHAAATALAMDAPPVVELLPAGQPALEQGAAVDDVLARHPAVLAIDARLAARETTIAIAEQGYRPQWRVDASYGYRDDDPLRGERADFFSVAVAFDLPLSTDRRQDQTVRSATASTEALRTERALLLRRLRASFESERTRLELLNERGRLYRERLLVEMREQAQASLAAYTNDDGDFAEVVRARIAVLNARIEALDIDVQRLATTAELNYLLTAGEVSP